MCWAASFSMVSASSWSLIEGREIFLTITEWPLTAVATALVLIRQSANSFDIALDTVPESTIIESTTMSEDSGSSPRCDTSICPPFFFNSTALMLEEPTSRPTIVFDPIPNMCARLFVMLRSQLHLARLLFHPLVQLRLLEAPAVAQLESRNLLFAYVLVKRVRTHSQVLRRLTDVHHFSRVGHVSLPQFLCLSTRTIPLQCLRHAGLTLKLLPSNACPGALGVQSIYQP